VYTKLPIRCIAELPLISSSYCLYRLEYMVGRAKTDLDELERRLAKAETVQQQHGGTGATLRAYMPQFLFVSICEREQGHMK